MGKLLIVDAKQLIKVIFKLGFVETRQKGSHKFFKHQDGRTTVVPFHGEHDLGKGLLRKILHDIKMSPDQFQALLKK